MPRVTVTSGGGATCATLLICLRSPRAESAMRLVPLLVCCLLPLSACAQDPVFSPDPESARLVTGDIERFWEAWDEAAGLEDPEARAAVFQQRYLDRGSPGLEAF